MSNVRARFLAFAVLTLGIAILGGGIFQIYQISINRKGNYQEGINSLNRGNCARALKQFSLLENNNKWFDRIDRLIEEAKPYRQQCQAWQLTLKEIENARENNDLAQILLSYNNFAGKHPSSKLVDTARYELKKLFNDVEAKLLTNDRSCRQVDSISKHQLIPDRDRNLPWFYLGCIEIYREKQDREPEFDFQTKFLTAYAKHEQAITVKQGLVQNPLVCDRSQQLQKSKAVSAWGNLMSVVYLTCGKAYQEVKNYQQAITFYRSIQVYYPEDELISQADSDLASIEREIKAITAEMSIAADTIKARITACTAGSIFFDWLIDLGEVFSGKDCMTGESLHDIERWLTIVPLVDGFKGASKLATLWQVIDTVATFSEVQQTQNLIQDRHSLLDFLNNRSQMRLLIAHNSKLASLTTNMGNAIDLSPHYLEVAEFLY